MAAERPIAHAPAERASPNRLALLLLAGVLLAWLVTLSAVLLSARLPPERSGLMIAVFPIGLDERERLLLVARADGALVRPTWLSNVWLVYGDDDGFVGRLQGEGAFAAFEPVVFQPITMPGCGLPVMPELEARARSPA